MSRNLPPNPCAAWSLAFHEHRSVRGRHIYPSRLNDIPKSRDLDRPISKISAVRVVPLIGAPGLATVINDLRVSLVTSSEITMAESLDPMWLLWRSLRAEGVFLGCSLWAKIIA